MAQQTLDNGDTGLEFRTKLNDMFGEVYSAAARPFRGVVVFPVIPFTPLAGINALEWNHPLLDTDGFFNIANPTRITIPSLPGPNPIGVLSGNLSWLDVGTPTDVSLVLRLDGSIPLEGASVGVSTEIGRLSFTTPPREFSAGEYYELLYEFGDVTDKTIQIVGTNLSFTYLGPAP
jgi:hypothetical protein